MSDRGVSKWELKELWPAVAFELGEYQVFADQHHLAMPAQVVPLPAMNADEERLGVLLAVASAVGLARQIEREDTSTVRLVNEGLVPELGLVDEAVGSELTFGTVLDKRVAAPAK